MKRTVMLLLFLVAACVPLTGSAVTLPADCTATTGTTISAAKWNTCITAVQTELTTVQTGGIRITGQAIGDLLTANSATTYTRIPAVGLGQVLTSQGAGVAPAWSASLAVPTGMVSFFNLAACPSGWSELTAARGRYVVGLPLSGTLAGTQGTALSNVENRAVGQHAHGVTDPGHTHGIPQGQNSAGTGALYQRSDVLSTFTSNSATTGVSVDNAGTVAGTNAPYIQLLACQKS